jgi:hypothetical protein
MFFETAVAPHRKLFAWRGVTKDCKGFKRIIWHGIDDPFEFFATICTKSTPFRMANFMEAKLDESSLDSGKMSVSRFQESFRLTLGIVLVTRS